MAISIGFVAYEEQVSETTMTLRMEFYRYRHRHERRVPAEDL
jgi:hypothetical protein